MKKYLSIPTINSGDVLISIGEGLFIATPAIGSGFIFMVNSKINLGLAVGGDEQQIVYSIQDALVNAAKTPHSDVVSTVILPNGSEVIGLVQELGPR
jgi:hypothetical protein